jgi:3D-(3,5/4)-trihydroxycyclohexane-1,2-dione acylhydrolase (decyclizing)
VIRVGSTDELRKALDQARRAAVTTVIHVETDPMVGAPDSPAWWDVPVAEVSSLDSTRRARERYEADRQAQRHHLEPPR